MDKVNYETNVKLEDLKQGDKVVLRHEGEVTSVNTYTGHVRLTDGARIRMTQGTSWDRVANGILFTADRRKPELPDFKAGQVWEDSDGVRYVIINGLNMKAYTMKDKMVLLTDLAKKPGIKIVFEG